MLKTSRDRHAHASWPASRSMSRYSQGVLARKLVNRPCSVRCSAVPAATIGSADVLQMSCSPVAAVLDHDLEAAGRAQALDRRRAEDVDQPPPDLVLKRRLQPGGDRVAGEPWLAPLVEVVEHARTSTPKFGALAFSRIDCPAMATVCVTPGCLPGDRLDLLHHRFGPLERGRVGQLHVDQQVALVLRRDEAGRASG